MHMLLWAVGIVAPSLMASATPYAVFIACLADLELVLVFFGLVASYWYWRSTLPRANKAWVSE
jgi:hypothetical protein